MAKKRTPDKMYTAPTNSDVIARIQGLLRDTNKGCFPWATVVSYAEMTFLYDMAAQAEINPGFQPTPKQGLWGIAIIKKIDMAKKTWDAAHGITT